MEELKMLIENKVQIEAIKTREYMAGKIENMVMFTEGYFIVYMAEKDCLIDISKIKEIPKGGLEKHSPGKIESLLKPIKLTNKALIFTERMIRLFESKETGDRIWIDDKYIKMFQGCDFRFADIGEEIKPIVFIRYGKIVGLVLPMRVSEELEN